MHACMTLYGYTIHGFIVSVYVQEPMACMSCQKGSEIGRLQLHVLVGALMGEHKINACIGKLPLRYYALKLCIVSDLFQVSKLS